ncbi:MAG: hypothetical protein COY58_05290 [Gammaproteobacteria bacterium CG_4_10_14_0_8_um_filter_38_16]|nr:MAG: hypothetical protein COY58_05290 [Gammaproteobacteria bacterium CG_4_10_14_0_8_um_filter_38_16]PJA02852.1 MAG: hypothetical protein COX72_08675 [Gammaproteobacteria bacterium CG_4_10_14_0_2_um_filter_38_22]PJB10688.1 MAG: hypothetical protein CO120_03585 [Gammaproteobacteria bacterium CG_4_9_14_3_um_filter_38_9]
MRSDFFKKKKSSKIVESGGPSKVDQLSAMSESRYWTVLNSSLLRDANGDDHLISRVNALKAALQTYGPTSDQLPNFRHNTGKAKGHIFHGHANNSNGTTYVVEWAVLCYEKRIMALVGFGTHENYRFRQTGLSTTEAKGLLENLESKKIMDHVAIKIAEAKKKASRTNLLRNHY